MHNEEIGPMTTMTQEEFVNILEYRFSRPFPRKFLRTIARILCWVALFLPRKQKIRQLVIHSVAPSIVWLIRKNRWAIDLVPPSDEKYWNRLADEWKEQGLLRDGIKLNHFQRAAYAFLGIEGSAMAFPKNWQVISFEANRFVERLYLRNEAGEECGGCPFGLGKETHGFACRTLMSSTNVIFKALETAKMKIDITIPEMKALERLIKEQVKTNPELSEESIWESNQSDFKKVFQTSLPEEEDFISDDRLRPETVSIIKQMVKTILEKEKPALFCQFRLIEA